MSSKPTNRRKPREETVQATVGAKTIRVNLTDHAVPGVERLQARTISDRIHTFGVDEAMTYIDLPIFEAERDVKENHVQTLVNEMIRGTFNEQNVTVARARLGSVTYKVNGQHTSWAVFLMQDHTPGYSITVRDILYEVDTAEQLRQLYATFDRASSRSNAHLHKVFLLDTEETVGIPARIIQRLVPGFKLWRFGADSHAEYAPEEIAHIIRQSYAKTFQQIAKFCQEHDEKELRRAPVYAAMWATWDRLALAAPEFWTPVADGTDLSAKTDPRWVLRNVLLKSRLRASAETGDDLRAMDQESMYRICISLWNKWRKNQTVSQWRVPDTRPEPL